MKKILIMAVIMFTTHAFSQTKSFKISGKIASEEDSISLESATVYLQRIVDSSLISYTITDKNGKFNLEAKTNDKKGHLFISYVGYQTHFQDIDLTKEQIDLGIISLKVSNALDEVLIRSAAPVTIKKDTLEFNANSFKTKKNAVIEDLLKELPGFEVDEEGNIKVNGKSVDKILVGGKTFFANDPSITTKNLSKDIIEKIQVSDTKTDAEAFAGEQGAQEGKTINLVIKKDKNKGVFGRTAAGIGTDDRFEYAGMFNYFNDDQRISVLAGGNNINSAGFSFGEIRNMLGGGNSISMYGNGSFVIDGRSFGAGEGITTSRSLGATYADALGKQFDVSANYFNGNSDSENESITERENILPDRRFFNNSRTTTKANTDSHNLGMEFNIKPDSTLLITVQPKIGYTKATSINSSEEESVDENLVLTNESTADSYVEYQSKSFSNNISFTKRFGNKGSFLRLNLYNDINSNQSDDFLSSELNIYGDNPDNIIRNQFRKTDDKTYSVYSALTYRLPIIGKEYYLDFKYEYRNLASEKNLNSYDFNDVTQEFNSIRTNFLSTDYKNINILKSPSLLLGYQDGKLTTSAEFKLVYRTLENNDAIRPNFDLTRNFDAVEFFYILNYRMSPQKSLYLNYRLKNNVPNISQLQEFSDVTNPLNIITGNRFLQPTNNHNFYVYYNSFNVQKGDNFYFYLNSDVINNNVVAKRIVNEDLTRETTYVNVDGVYRLNSSISYDKKIKIDSLKTINVSAGFSPSINRSINFNNEIQYANTSRSLSPYIGTRFVWKDVLELRTNYYVTYSKNSFNIQGLEDQEFLYHNLYINNITHFTKKLEWQNDVRFNYNPNIAPGFQKSAWFWNSTLSYLVLKDQGAVTLKVYDLLNQNTNARRTITENYIQDSQNTVLRQYFMLSFSWKFNSLGAKGETGNRGGMMMGY